MSPLYHDTVLIMLCFEIKNKFTIIFIFSLFVSFLIISLFTDSVNWPFIKYDMFITIKSKSQATMLLQGVTVSNRLIEIDINKLFKIDTHSNIILYRFYKLKKTNPDLFFEKMNNIKKKFNSQDPSLQIKSINLILKIIPITTNENYAE